MGQDLLLLADNGSVIIDKYTSTRASITRKRNKGTTLQSLIEYINLTLERDMELEPHTDD